MTHRGWRMGAAWIVVALALTCAGIAEAVARAPSDGGRPETFRDFRKITQNVDLKEINAVPDRPVSIFESRRAIHRVRVAQASGNTSTNAAAPTGSDYQLSLVREGDTLALGGFVPDAATRDALLAAVRAAAPDTSVFDMVEVKPAAPDGFAAAVAWAVTSVMRMKPGAVLIAGDGITVEGRPQDPAARAALTAALAARPAGFALTRVALALPVAKPFVLTLRRDGQGVVVEGAAPSEDEKNAILASARAAFPGSGLADRLTVADGAPAGVDWAAAARFGLVQLARLKEGVVRLEDGKVSVEGEPIDRAGFAAVSVALRDGLPTGLALGTLALKPPVVAPYRWFVERGPAGILIQGYVPSEEARAAARAVVAGHFGTLAVRDTQQIGGGAPEGFADAVVAAVKQLVLLPKGRVTIDDRSLSVAGEVPSEPYANAVRGALQRLAPAGYAVNHAILAQQPVAAAAPAQPAAPRVAAAAPPRATAPDTCSPKIREEMAAGGIVFQFGRETMRPESVQRLRRIAAIMKECPDTKFSVEGHTDSDGIPDQNVDLSQRRAQAVVSLLIRQGVEAGRLLAEGHGSSRSVVPNDSPANKARNRRIEFVAR